MSDSGDFEARTRHIAGQLDDLRTQMEMDRLQNEIAGLEGQLRGMETRAPSVRIKHEKPAEFHARQNTEEKNGPYLIRS